MASESIHKKLERVRKPHVHITYEVFTDGAREVKELPFVMGVLGDFSGNPTKPLKSLQQRNFVPIDRDNFNEIMAKMNPGLEFRVENTMQPETKSEINVTLKFNSMDDFEPANIVSQVEPLQKILDARNKLRDLQTYVDRLPGLEGVLEEVLKNTERIQAVAEKLPGAAEEPKKEGGQ